MNRLLDDAHALVFAGDTYRNPPPDKRQAKHNSRRSKDSIMTQCIDGDQFGQPACLTAFAVRAGACSSRTLDQFGRLTAGGAPSVPEMPMANNALCSIADHNHLMNFFLPTMACKATMASTTCSLRSGPGWKYRLSSGFQGERLRGNRRVEPNPGKATK
jgi:hypothetical protein